MADPAAKAEVETRLKRLVSQLGKTQAKVESMRSSGVEAGEARSLELLQGGIDTAVENISQLQKAVSDENLAETRHLGEEMAQHMRIEIARDQILSDLKDVVKEAEEELPRRVGRHRNPVKQFIKDGSVLETHIAEIIKTADLVVSGIGSWTHEDFHTEADMAHTDDLLAIKTAIEQVGKQLSFASARMPASGGTGSTGAGAFRTVTAQMSATLDALGMPHYGVQFATDKNLDMARDTLIESLLAEFSETQRNGTTVFSLGEGARRAISPDDGRLLAGAAKSAARRVRAEADNILDILDRLPDMTRFRIERGVTDSAEARKEVEERFLDLDEVMADPYGVNFARANYTIFRIVKGLLDYLDYADLEPEFAAAFLGRPEDVFSQNIIQILNLDEIAKRRSPVTSEELEFEIRELVGAFFELVQDALAPLVATRGNAAARLELAMTAVYGSAHDLRDILVRTGSTLDEQDLMNFSTQLTVDMQPLASFVDDERIKKVHMSVGQLMDWIIEVSRPFTGASFRAAMRERASLKILERELYAQSKALGRVIKLARTRGFTLSLPGPMHQLEVLDFQIEQANTQAKLLVADSARSTS